MLWSGPTPDRRPMSFPFFRPLLIASVALFSVAAEAVDKLVMRLFEPGIEPYYSRYLVDERWLRIDEGRWSEQFILFDRREGSIYSIDHEAGSVMVVERRPLDGVSPIPLDERVEGEPSLAYRVAGVDGEGWRVTVNGRFCQAVASLPGLFPEASSALAEYRAVLAAEHAGSLGAVPPELLEGCDLALNIFHAGRHLEWGLPLEVWEARGYGEVLIDVERNVEPEAGWDWVPDTYHRFSPGS